MGALIASLFAVGASPAAAVEIEGGDDDPAKASKVATFSACVGDAVSDGGFTDVSEDSVHSDAINCLSYYGITKGKTADTYAPGDNVSRWQMVQFMERTAALTGADADDTLGDFAETGSDPVSRTDMAVLLVRLLASAASGVVQIDDEGDVTYGDFKEALDEDNLDYFADTRAQNSGVSRVEDNLISAAFELGITNGTGDGSTFSPDDNVTRAQMASFITRALGHTHVRPAGVTAQPSGSTVHISVRDADFAPVTNQPVDAFSVATARVDDAFNNDGSCARLVDEVPEEADAGTCELTEDDSLTNADGQIEHDVTIGSGITVWAWTGDEGDEVDDDTDLYRLEVTPDDLGADQALVTSNMAQGAQAARYGATITFTIQLQNAGAGADVGPGSADISYSVTVKSVIGGVTYTDRPVTVSIGDDGSGEFEITADDPDGDDDGDTTDVTYELLPGDGAPNAKVKYFVDTNDQLPGPDIDDDTMQWTSETESNFDGTDDETDNPTGATGTVQFRDNRGDTVALVAFVPGTISYEHFSPRGATVRPTVAVLNEYGQPLRSRAVKLGVSAGNTGCNEGDEQLAGNKQYFTSSSGTVRIPHKYGSGDDHGPGSQRLLAVYPGADGEYGNGVAREGASLCADIDTGEVDEDNDPITEPDPDVDNQTSDVPFAISGQSVMLYWLGADSNADTDSDSVGGDILAGDVGKDEVVVDLDEDDNDATVAPTLVLYDDNDRFTVVDHGETDEDDSETSAVDMDDFEDALDGAIGSGSLAWRFYDHRDSREITEWTLTIGDE